ncbi:restriction endonuclease subunit S [Spirosoma foliorum]|uniref:Restriction endonuclease subunit S n=1 Tax=Spirosoma foliorum TaxID=2710596 RepID=A0A7G5GWA4_9BACT|nr:restriction endonuclease subunit S [Spirosoma foliorum]QMW03146.1 restriction endonuclease subunit S [Spirosoma foliorum]
MSEENKVIPELRFPEFKDEGEWEEKTLDEVATFLKGKGISKSDIVEKGILPCIRYGQLYTHYKETINEVISYTNAPAEDLILSQINDVIIPSSGETKEDIATASCVMKAGIALGGDLNIIRSNTDGIFLSYYLSNAKKKEISKMAQGISVVHLYSSQLKNLKIQIPSKAEQQKIASCLSSLDVIITAHSQKLELLKEHKKSLMQNLFPQEGETVPQYRFPEFVNDGDWKEKKLGELSEIGRGKSKHRPRDATFLYGGKYPFVQTGDIKKAALYLTEYNQTYSEEGLKQSKLWNEGTLCITIAANIAETAILKIKACFPDSIIGLVPNNDVADGLFIKYLFDEYKSQIQNLSQGVAQDNLNQEKLLQIKFLFPTLSEQKKIASCLSSLDELIAAQADKIDQLKLHKKGLMQALFPKMDE